MDSRTKKEIEIGGAIFAGLMAVAVLIYYVVKQNTPMTSNQPNSGAQAASIVGSILLGVPVPAAQGVIPTPAQEEIAMEQVAWEQKVQKSINDWAAKGNLVTHPVGFGVLPVDVPSGAAWFPSGAIDATGKAAWTITRAILAPNVTNHTGTQPITSI